MYRITGAGQGELYYATGQGNVTGVDDRCAGGRLLAGTEPNGILYRITAKDKAFVLYDSNLPEIRAVSPNADGSVYAVALGGALAKKVQARHGESEYADGCHRRRHNEHYCDGRCRWRNQTARGGEAAGGRARGGRSGCDHDHRHQHRYHAGGGKARIYRINADNTVDTLWSSKEENVYDILPAQDGQVYFTTDESGRIYRLSRDSKLTLVAQTNEAEATRLIEWRGSMLAATGNMGKIYRLGPSGNSGKYESPVFDAGGAWPSGDGCGGRATTVRARLPCVRAAATASGRMRRGVIGPIRSTMRMAGRSRVRMRGFYSTKRVFPVPGATIENVSAAYLPQNNPPVIHSVTVLTTVTPVVNGGAAKGGIFFR